MWSRNLPRHRFGDRPGTNTPSANLHPLYLAGLQLYANGLKIGHETPFGLIVGVADIVADLGPFITNFTKSRHDVLPDA
jgi:hypothetical protein